MGYRLLKLTAQNNQFFPRKGVKVHIILNERSKEKIPLKATQTKITSNLNSYAKHEPTYTLTPWKTVLNEIITGNTFGADRIDYLLRDSWHVGVAYGRFDPDRLIDGLRLVIDPQSNEITLGLDSGSIHAAEALLLARYFMYTQVYFHDVRRVYDLHLRDYLVAWLDGGKFPTDWNELIRITDNEVLAALSKSAMDSSDWNHAFAMRVMDRQHFRTVFDLVASHKKARPTIFNDVLNFALEEWGPDNVRSDTYGPKSETNNFLVLNEDGSTESSLQASSVISTLPAIEIGLIFVSPSLKEEAKRAIDRKQEELLQEAGHGVQESHTDSSGD